MRASIAVPLTDQLLMQISMSTAVWNATWQHIQLLLYEKLDFIGFSRKDCVDEAMTGCIHHDARN